jgi:hypothetical protein
MPARCRQVTALPPPSHPTRHRRLAAYRRRLAARSYLDQTGKSGIQRKSTETQFGIFIRNQVPGLVIRERRGGNLYVFPPLAECRAAFAKAIQQPIAWPSPNDWGGGTASATLRDADGRPLDADAGWDDSGEVEP